MYILFAHLYKTQNSLNVMFISLSTTNNQSSNRAAMQRNANRLPPYGLINSIILFLSASVEGEIVKFGTELSLSLKLPGP
jgi:hypothetical protein